MNRPVLLTTLFVSLALNVFGVGAFMGARLNGDRPEASPMGPVPERRDRSPVNTAVRTLSPEAQAAWRAQRPAFLATPGPGLRDSRRIVQGAIQGLGADPFDATVATSNLVRARDMENRSRLAMDARLVAFAASLSPQDRAKFAEALARPRQARNPRQAAAPAMD